MRKRILIVSAVAALTVGLAAVANGAVTSQTVKGNVTPAKQSVKQRGGVTLRADTDAAFDAYTGPGNPSSHVERSVIHFDNDFAFSAGNLPQCNRATIENTTTEAAKAVCGSSLVGGGSANTDGLLGPRPAVVTAFNGVPKDGRQVILLHARVSAPPVTSILEGIVGPSERGGDYGQQLDVAVEPLAGGFQVITHFDTTVEKRVVKPGKKAKKKKGKKGKKKPPTYFVSARCADKNKTWNYAGDFYFVANDGSQTVEKISAESSQKCVPKKAKKKKKKK